MSRAESPLPLDDVLSSSVAFEWSHGVAVVLQLVDQLAPEGQFPSGAFPDVDRIALAPAGFLLTQFEPLGSEPLFGLGRLLHRLLAQTTAPPALRLLVLQASASHPTISYEELTGELTKWDPPNRLGALADLHARVLEDNLEPAEAKRDRGRFGAAPWRGSLFTQVVVAGCGAVAVSSLVTFLWYGPRLSAWPASVSSSEAVAAVQPAPPQRDVAPLQVPPASPLETADSGPVALVPDAIASVRPATGALAAEALPDPRSPDSSPRGAAPPAARAARAPLVSPSATTVARTLPASTETVGYSPAVMREAEERFRDARALFEQQDYAAAATGFLEVVEVLQRGDPTLELRQIAAELADASRALSTNARIEAAQVYTSADEDVTEPVARAHLPPLAGPGTPPDQIGVLELLIDTRGRVESAHLIDADDQHFRDRWWTSAAKAWLFEPAIKEGQPVRFLKRHTFLLSRASGPQ
ncbi:MAG: hypothetical protein AB7F99_05865 [Vicinamibacterales bacterium]